MLQTLKLNRVNRKNEEKTSLVELTPVMVPTFYAEKNCQVNDKKFSIMNLQVTNTLGRC
jgi:hypothetical protein